VKLEAGNSVEAPKEDMAGKKRKAEEVHTPPPSPKPPPHLCAIAFHAPWLNGGEVAEKECWLAFNSTPCMMCLTECCTPPCDKHAV